MLILGKKKENMFTRMLTSTEYQDNELEWGTRSGFFFGNPVYSIPCIMTWWIQQYCSMGEEISWCWMIYECKEAAPWLSKPLWAFGGALLQHGHARNMWKVIYAGKESIILNELSREKKIGCLDSGAEKYKYAFKLIVSVSVSIVK